MEFKLNEDQQLMKDMFVEFTEQFVKPIAAELDEQERFPEELIPQFLEALDDAGIDDVIAAKQEQLDAFLAEK